MDLGPLRSTTCDCRCSWWKNRNHFGWRHKGGTHVLKALSLGATACSFGKGFLFALGAGGQKGVEALLQRMHDEIRRDMILLGCKTIKDLNKTNIAYR